VTNTRLVLRRGIFGRDMVQLRLQRITEIHYQQSLPERLVGTGRLLIEVQGEDGAIVIDDIRHPRALQRVITNQLDGYDGLPPLTRDSDSLARTQTDRNFVNRDTPPRGVPGVGGATRSGSLADQLIELDDLRRRGILTEWEFQAKKAEILNRH
jgi:hypothetical protein